MGNRHCAPAGPGQLVATDEYGSGSSGGRYRNTTGEQINRSGGYNSPVSPRGATPKNANYRNGYYYVADDGGGNGSADYGYGTLNGKRNNAAANAGYNSGAQSPRATGATSKTPAADMPSKAHCQKGFLAQLFSRAPNTIVDATETLAKHSPKSKPQPLDEFVASAATATSLSAEKVVLLKDRPALRLDSRLICKYEVLSVIGKGSFSQVLRVQDRLTRQYYAVKLVSTDSDFGAVNNELSILSRVRHPFVIRLEEVFRGISRLFIVMEMASGGEMYDRVVSKGRYTETEARQAIRMLLTGLDYLHGIHITHRDLKPENLLYSDERPEARLLITDFGLAHQSPNADEKMFETCGTPEYIAPEILLRMPYSNKVDLWAVGVIAYILMSGIMPFDDDNRSRLYSHIITADYVYYPMFWAGSELAKQFVDDLLDTNAERRPSAMDALNHEWIVGKSATTVATAAATRQQRANSPAYTDHSASAAMQRTKSSRSIRSVTRSDHGHRVDPREVDKLADDLERLARNRHQHHSNPSSRHHHQHHQHHNRHASGENASDGKSAGGNGNASVSQVDSNNNALKHSNRKHHGNANANAGYASPTTKHYGMI